MKLFAPVVIALALAVPSFSFAADAPSTATGDSIAWETTFAAAAKKAEAEKKPLLLKFYTGWCPFCTKMEKTTWVDAGVAKATESFACGKINADVEAPAVARYHTVGYPTIILANPEGEPIVKMEGYKDPATMTTVLTSYIAKKDDLFAALDTLKKDKKSATAQLTIADFQAGAGLNDQAADTYAKAAKGAQGADLVRAQAGQGLSLTRAGKAQDASKLLAKALESAGASPSPALMLALGENEKALGHADKAKTWLNRVVTEAPGTHEAEQAKLALDAG